MCGDTLLDPTAYPEAPNRRTQEHVFPRWLQSDHDMWNQAIHLKNTTTLPYRSLTVNACYSCNSQHLGPLEERVATAFRTGTDAVRALDRRDLYLWLTKLYYCLLFKELTLQADRRTPTAGSITTSDQLSGYSLMHALLQAARGLVTWPTDLRHDIPGSITILTAQQSSNTRLNFSYVDGLGLPYLAVRIRETAVFAVLEDWGEFETKWAHTTEPDNLFPQLHVAKSLALTPTQFTELAVLVNVLARDLDRHWTYLTLQGADGLTLIPATATGNSNPSGKFGPQWFQAYAAVLASHLHRPLSDVYDSERGVVSWICDTNGIPNPAQWNGQGCVDPKCNHTDTARCGMSG